MVWPFFSLRQTNDRSRSDDLARKVALSQSSLLVAATDTANAAQVVTNRLKSHLEDALRQFEATARIMTDALIICDRHGQVKAFNPAAETMFGRTGMSVDQHIVGSLFRINDAVPTSYDALWQALENGADVCGYHSSGYTFAIRTTVTHLDLLDGSSLLMILAHDLSQQRAAQRRLDDQTAMYDALVDLSAEGIMIVQDGQVVAANAAAESLFGQSASILHTSAASLLDLQLDRMEAPQSDPAGDKIGSTRPLLFSSARITWKERPGILMTVRDSRSVREIDVLLRARHATRVDMLCAFAPDFTVLHANPAFCDLYGVRRQDIVGRPLVDILPEEQRDAFLMTVQRLSPQNPMRRRQLLLSDGCEPRLQDWIDYAFYDHDGHVIEYQRSGQDVTEVLSQIRGLQREWSDGTAIG